eukprot:6475175-Amphidinium_carterae.1
MLSKLLHSLSDVITFSVELYKAAGFSDHVCSDQTKTRMMFVRTSVRCMQTQALPPKRGSLSSLERSGQHQDNA